MSEDLLKKQLEREKQKNAILTKMVEDKTRELYLEQLQLEHSNVFLDSILQTMTASVLVCDANLNISKVNTAATELIGLQFEELMKQALNKVFDLSEIKIPLANQKLANQLKIENEALIYNFASKRKIPIYYSLSSVSNENQIFDGLIIVLFDISSRKELERQLLQAQKLQSIGQLSAGIAHEINTPIQFVRDNLDYLGKEYKNLSALVSQYQTLVKTVENEQTLASQITAIKKAESDLDLDYTITEINSALEESLSGAEAVAKIVNSMKAFSHPGNAEKQVCNLNKAIESTITVSRNEWRYFAELEALFDPDLPEIPCHVAEINQVLLNLIINATHAIADATDNGKKGLGKIIINTSHDTQNIQIEIKDTGKGIPKDIQDKIFDPFFTTKGVGKGTGQGLALAHSTIVEKHQGRLEFETKENIGTSFKITLPRISISKSRT